VQRAGRGRDHRVRRGVCASASLVLVAGLVGIGGTSAAAGPPVVRVSVASAGTQGTGASDNPVLSGDGTAVAFESTSKELVAGDTNAKTDVFVRTLATGAVERVSVATDGTEGVGDADQAAISTDGRFVAFRSAAANLVPGDTNGVQDVFVRDRVARTTTRVSVSTAGAAGTAASDSPSISGDGSRVAFRSAAPNLVPNDTQGYTDVFVRDLVAGTTTRVSVSNDGGYAAGTSFQPAISADGQHVAFATYGFNLVPQGTNDKSQIFVRHLAASTTDQVSVTPSGGSGTGDSTRPGISGDGALVVFRSLAANLVTGDTNALADIFLRDLRTGTTSRVGSPQPNGASDDPSISAGGRVVAFKSDATNTVSGDTNNQADVFARDLQLGVTRRISLPATGQANGLSSRSSVSSDGRGVVFRSVATNLVTGDTNGQADIFYLDQGPLPAPDLAVTLVDDADPILAGASASTTATVTNRGNAPASGIVLTAPLPSGTTFESATPPAGGSCAVTTGTTIRCDLPGLVAGASSNVRLTVRTPSSPATITLTATATSVEVDANGADNTATQPTTTGLPDLVTTVTDQADPVGVGGRILDTVAVRNSGIVGATGVVVTVPVPSTTSVTSATGPAGACTVAAGQITCALGGIAAQATVIATLDLRPSTETTVVVSATAAGNETDATPADNAGSQSTTIGLPDLHPTVSASANPVAYDADVTVSAVVRNSGTAPSSQARVAFSVPSKTTYVRSAGPAGACTGTTVVTCPLGALAVGADATASVTLHAQGDWSDVTVSATTSNVGQTDRAPADDTSSIAIRLQGSPAPDVGVQVVAASDVVAPNADIDLTATVTNTGSLVATAVTLSDAMPTGVVARSATPATGSCTVTGGNVQCALGNLDPGAATTVRLLLRSAADRTVANTVNVASSDVAPNADPDESNNQATTTVVVGRPDLGTRIQLDAPSLRLGGDSVATATVDDHGTAPADTTSVRYTVPVGVAIVSATAGGSSCALAGRTATCQLGHLDVGGAATASLTFRPSAAGSITVTALASSSRTDRSTADNTGSATLSVVAPDLGLTFNGPTSPQPLGRDLAFTATSRNQGTADALGTSLSLPVPAGASVVSASVGPTACAVGATITCALDTVPVGGSLDATVVLRPARAGALNLSGTLTSSSPDAATADNAATSTTTVVAPNVVVTNLNYRDYTTVGLDVTYRYTVGNSGSATATGGQLTTTVPANTTLRTVVPSAGTTCTTAGTSISCALASLAVGGEARVVITIRPDLEGFVAHSASVTSNEVDDDPASNSVQAVIKATDLNEYAVAAWQTNGTVNAVLRVGGIIYVGGSFTAIRPAKQPPGVSEQPRAYAAAFNAATGQPVAWNPGFDSRVLTLAAAPDGTTLFAGGEFTKVGGVTRNRLARVQLGNGALTSWAPDANGTVHSVLVGPGGRDLFVGGPFSYISGVARARVAKLSIATGVVDPGWIPAVAYPENPTANNVRTLALSPDGGSVYIGGVFSTVNGLVRQSVAKVDAATGATSSWDARMEKKVWKNETEIYALAPAGDKVFVCGDFYRVGTVVSPNLGAVDATTGDQRPDWVGTTDGAVNTCAASATRLYVGGHFDWLGGANADPHSNPSPTGILRHHLGSLDIVTGQVTVWDPGADGVEGMYAVAVMPDGVAYGGQQQRAGHWVLQQGPAWFLGRP
jgi:uncharacterized repeat protein (TIGR01451 family)